MSDADAVKRNNNKVPSPGKSRASSVLWKQINVLLVATEVAAHRDSWLFALAMVHNVEVRGDALSERASKAVFALSSMISTLD